MDLLKNIKDDRARQRRKHAYESKVFNTVGCIVKAYGLGKDFLKQLEGPRDDPAQKMKQVREVKAKKSLELPPYCLVSREEYGLVLAIMERLDNPYLSFTRSPEEMLLSASLYESNPSLKPRDLLGCDFEALLLCQGARKELAALERRSGIRGGMDRLGRGWERDDGEGSDLSSLQERIKQLQAFVAKVEDTGFQAE